MKNVGKTLVVILYNSKNKCKKFRFNNIHTDGMGGHNNAQAVE